MEEQNIISIIETTLSSKANEIDEISKSKDTEITYKDLERDYILKTLIEKGIINCPMPKSEENAEYCWLGERDVYIDKAIGKLNKENFNEKSLKTALGNYCNLKYTWTNKKLKAFDKVKEQGKLFHGSTNNNISEFKPRAKTSGDKVPLVYFSNQEDYCKCYIFSCKNIDLDINSEDKTVNFSPRLQNQGNSELKAEQKQIEQQELTLRDIILNNDVGGCLYAISGDNIDKFGIAMSKSDHEFVSTENIVIKQEEKVLILSALNELIIKNIYTVKISDKPITINELLRERDSLIKDIKDKKIIIEDKKILEKPENQQKILERLEKRLKNQQQDAINLIEEREKDHLLSLSYEEKVMLERYKSLLSEKSTKHVI